MGKLPHFCAVFVIVLSSCVYASDFGATLILHAGTQEASLSTSLEEIKTLGFSHVALQTFEFQTNTKSTVIKPIPEKSAPLNLVRSALKTARTKKLSSILVPILLLDQPTRSEWRGNLHPQDFKIWSKSYVDMMLKYAALAQEYGAETLVLGSELSSIESQPQFWEELIQEVKTVFSGKLTYAFNWDQLSESKVWDKLDFVALSSYFELAKKNEKPSEETLRQRWQPILGKIRRWSDIHRKKVLFLEVGYPSHVQGLYQPWNYVKQPEADLILQASGLRVFLDIWRQENLTQGMMIYTWDSDSQQKTGYAIKGKPAEAVVREYLKKPY